MSNIVRHNRHSRAAVAVYVWCEPPASDSPEVAAVSYAWGNKGKAPADRRRQYNLHFSARFGSTRRVASGRSERQHKHVRLHLSIACVVSQTTHSVNNIPLTNTSR